MEKVIINMTVADDAWGRGWEPEDDDELEDVHSRYEAAIDEIAQVWWPDAEMEINVTYVPTSLRDAYYVELQDEDGETTDVLSDEDSRHFANQVWDAFCAA